MPLSNKGWDETASCSTDLRRQSRCRPALTDTRAQARGDTRMASDESDGKAGKSADDVRDEFEEKMDRLRRQYERDLHSFRYEIEEREYRLKAYEDKFNKIKQPPLLYAYVVRKEGPDLDGNQVVVARATELLKVSTGLMDKSQLGVGQYVWVHPQTYAIVEGSAVRNEGVIAKVADMMDGKLVKAIAKENDMTFFNVSIADVLSKWVGESERIIKEIFRQAHEKKPSIVFFDEIEALFTVRGMMDTSGVHKNIIAQILSEMDGLVELHDVFVIGATNRADLVDPALLRPGRFDEIIEIPRPDRKAAEEILRIYLNEDLPTAASLDEAYGGHKEAVDALRRFVLDELYGENKWVKVKLDAEAKEAIKTVKRKDIISGAIIEAIVTTAKKNFVKRGIQLKNDDRTQEGLTMKDLDMAIDEESKEHAITEMYVYEKRQREVFRTGADPMVGGRMKKMVQGTEHEYTLYCRKMGTMGFDPHMMALDLLRDSDLHLAGEFITNGSRVYYDVGHFEVSTAETTNFHDVVIWEKAGEKILDWLRRIMEEKYTGDMKIHAFKNNTSPDGTSYGSHENYCVSRDVPFPGQFIRDLVPHLATRIIYTGAGDIVRGKYVLSPMAFLTSQVVSGETMHDTGILNTRDEPHADGRLWRRLHVIVGDALMNETAIMLRHFVTSGVLQLMEDGRLDDVPRLKDPIRDLWHNVEIRNPEQWKVELEDGRIVSPIDIQRYYLEKIESIVKDDWEKRALRTFEEVLDGLEYRRSKELAHRIEWLDRWFAIQEAGEKKAGPDVDMMACKQYSEIGAERSLFFKRQRAGLVGRITDDDTIKKAIQEPPKDTRAARRWVA